MGEATLAKVDKFEFEGVLRMFLGEILWLWHRFCVDFLGLRECMACTLMWQLPAETVEVIAQNHLAQSKCGQSMLDTRRELKINSFT